MRVILIALAALGLAACSTPGGHVCDGWKKLTPSPATRSYAVGNDPAFAGQVAGHNGYGKDRGCWK